MKNFILTICLMLLLSLVSHVVAQSVTISGTVTDDSGDALPGATVVVEVEGASRAGTFTDEEGKYQLGVDIPVPFTLMVTYIGYSPAEKEIDQTGEVKADFSLSSDALGLDEVVVTGVVNPRSKLNSSVSITTLKPEGINQSSPRTTAEILRTIPGIRSEASGGDGNTNITVRGVPISAGGSKYLQLQEDGLPVFLFGDMAFATSDIFLRTDANLARVEAIRGGAASTMATNSPAGIINFISKTGAVEGGSVATTFGLDYNSLRTDFDYGSPLGNGVSFHIGGFLRSGEGPRHTGYTANSGGQLKANLTKTFKNGYARVYLKHLNDRTAAYMPMPIQVSGTNANPTWESIDGFSATQGTPHSVYLQSNFGLGADGERRRVDVADGLHPKSNSVGAEFSFDLGDGWNIQNRSRLSSNSGRFLAPFTASVGTTQAMVDAVATATGRDLTGATLTYAHDGAPYTGELSQVIHMFDTELKNFDNLVSDTKLSKTFDNVTVNAGFFKAQQNVNMAWLWNSYLMEVKGENAGLINIMTADSMHISESGQFAYGVPVWGNCCQVEFNSKYNLSAPYASISVEANENLSIDASFRYDMGRVTGVGAGGAQATLDVNNDGIISPIEESVSVVNLAQKNPVNYDYSYASYSVGANYKLSSDQAIFVRYSHGGSAKADRAIFPSGSYLSLGNPKDLLDQAELGWKKKFKTGGLFVTAFYAGTTEEGGFEATTQMVIENDYQALGLEVEGAFDFGDFQVRGALTYTNAEITSGDNMGNTPRRQPDLMYNLIPAYTFGDHSIGLSFIGQTDAFAQDDNMLVMPGYTIVNGFVNIGITKGLSLSLNANNLLDTIGITESEEGAITEGQINYIRARSITGRSISGTIRYTF